MQSGLKKEAIQKVVDVFKRYDEIESAILYGSRAKGNYKPGSDIDLTLTGKNLTLKIINKIDNDIDDLLLPWVIDLSIFAQIENPELIEHIHRNGQLFYTQTN